MNADGEFSTPSVVFLDRSGWGVGREALKAAEFEPERVARFARRNAEPSGHSQHEPLPPEVIQALILKKLREDASLKIGTVNKAVIGTRQSSRSPPGSTNRGERPPKMRPGWPDWKCSRFSTSPQPRRSASELSRT